MHLLGLKELSAVEIHEILDRALHFSNTSQKFLETHTQTYAANLFFENSTRTRCAFETAEKRLGMKVLNFSQASSSIEKGETIYDTVRTIESLGADIMVIRLTSTTLLEEMAGKVRIPFINAGDGEREHPTQALLDLYTMRQHFSSFKGLRVGIIGDIRHSRVARSNLWALRCLGAEVVFCAPEQMQDPSLARYARYVDMNEALNSDVVMMLRVQFERHSHSHGLSNEIYRKQFGLTAARAANLKEHTIILHPAPVNRNVEIDDEVVEHPKSKIFEQVKNGVNVRMAVLERCLNS